MKASEKPVIERPPAITSMRPRQTFCIARETIMGWTLRLATITPITAPMATETTMAMAKANQMFMPCMPYR